MPVSRSDRVTYGTLLVLLCGLPVQADNEDAIARCARIATVGDRILCLEDALRQSSKDAAHASVVKAVPPNATAVVEAMPVNETTAVDAMPVNETTPVESMPVNETTAVEDMPVNETAAAVTPTAMDEAVPPADESFGLKEKRSPKETTAVQVTVTSVRKNLTNKFIFKTEDGQLWLQTDQRTVRYGDAPFDAEIRAASMGSFFLRPVAGGVSVRVRREK